jgi:predicted PurR-regulated permease PerM
MRRVTTPPPLPPPPSPRPHHEQQIVAMVRWLLILAFVVLGWIVLHYAARVLAPILAAFGIAYLLSPVLERLVARKVPRTVGALLILIAFLGTLVGLVTAFAPMVADQVQRFVLDLPRLIDTLSHWIESTFGLQVPADWKAYMKSDAVTSAVGDASGPIRQIAGAALGGVVGVLHVLEAMILTPKIVGHRVGLSEAGALFAVVAGGKLLGFVGILLAVPIAATVAVLIRHLMKVYEHSEFFGTEADAIVPVTAGMALVMPDAGMASAVSPPAPDPTGLGPGGAVDQPSESEIKPEEA